MSKPPRWARRHVKRCLAAIGAADVPTCLHWRQHVNENTAAIGECTTEPRYHRACIALRNDLKPNAHGYEVVTHEVAHVAGRHRAQAMDRILELIPEGQRDHALALWHDGDEADTTHLARGLAPVIRRAR